MSESAVLPRLQLRRNEDRRIRQGHHWVYSNEIDTTATPLKQFTAGEQVQLCTASGKPLGVAFVNPHSLICARLLDRHATEALGDGFLRERLRTALSLRERLFSEPCYRLVYGDSDGLSGLIVDRYGEVLVVQVGTAGMERLEAELIAFCQLHLATMKCPRSVEFDPALPRLPTGKLYKKGLRDRYWQGKESRIV